MRHRQPLRLGAICTVIAGALILAACAPRLEQPAVLHAPYPAVQLWAVAPFVNESGTAMVETDRVADMFVQQLQDVRGINTIPVNRVIVAMRELEMRAVRSPGDARELMRALGVDALVVGSVTAYDPYRPMTFGAAIELHVADHRAHHDYLDTRRLTRSPRGEFAPAQLGPRNPTAQAAAVFDARNHQTLAWLDDYAKGRAVPDSAFGKDIYLVRMDLYMQFASYRLLHDLLASEWIRLRPIVEQSPDR